MSDDNLTISIADNIGILTINRPKALNALDSGTLQRLSSKVTELESNDDVHVIVITGAGDRAFVAGGGMNHGQMIGATDAKAAEAVERPVHFGEVHSTLYHHLGIDPNLVTLTDLSGRPHYLVDGWKPLPELVG